MKYPASVACWFIATIMTVALGPALLDAYYLIALAGAAVIFALAIRRQGPRAKRRLWLTAAVTVAVATLVSPSLAYREISFPNPPNPFADLDGESGSHGGTFSLFDAPYWRPQAYERRHLAGVRGDRLIKFSQHERSLRIRGAGERQILEAFGAPTAQRNVGQFHVWEYRPWTGHPDWIMPVYVRDGALWSVGDETKNLIIVQ
jgi:hypothetical protein